MNIKIEENSEMPIHILPQIDIKYLKSDKIIEEDPAK